MLASLLELQQNLKEQLQLSQEKLSKSKSEAEKLALQEEITQLDRQFSETTSDFERIATGVEPALFSEKSLRCSAGRMNCPVSLSRQSRN